jgi:NCAIR mutase (PurE)-related protein
MGVERIHRLFVIDINLRDCDVFIVATGMEGALPCFGYGTSLSGPLYFLSSSQVELQVSLS